MIVIYDAASGVFHVHMNGDGDIFLQGPMPHEMTTQQIRDLIKEGLREMREGRCTHELVNLNERPGTH